jgi:hypothetical protein
MKWQCALLQRWLPEYPDGDLPAFWQRRLKSHLEHCPACRQELAALREVVAAIKAAPVTEPSPEFWTEFSRELHLKLAQVSHEIQAAPQAPRPWWGKLPYILGAPALAILALWLVTYFTNPERPALAPQPQVATQEAPPQAVAPPKVAAVPQAERAQTPAVAEVPKGAAQEIFSYATLEDNSLAAETEDDLDVSSWDLDAVLAGMTDQEKETFLKKLHQKKKDGSCLEKSFSIALA